MKMNVILKALSIVCALSGATVLQATAVAPTWPDADTRSSAPPTLLSNGLVSVGVNPEDLLRAIREAIVNEKLVQTGRRPFYLTAAEKTSPGGGVLMISTQPNDEGFKISVMAYPGSADLGVPVSLDIRLSFAKKQGVAEDEMARRLAKVNAENRMKIFSAEDSICVQTSLSLPEVATWSHIGQAISTHAVSAMLFAAQNRDTNSPLVE